MHFKSWESVQNFNYFFFFNYEQVVKYWDKYSGIGQTLNRTIREWIVCVMQIYSSVGLPKGWWGDTSFLHIGGGSNKFLEAGIIHIVSGFALYIYQIKCLNFDKMKNVFNFKQVTVSLTVGLLLSVSLLVASREVYIQCKPALGLCVPKSVCLVRKKGKNLLCWTKHRSVCLLLLFVSPLGIQSLTAKMAPNSQVWQDLFASEVPHILNTFLLPL